MAFAADGDAAAGRLRLSGACRMADLPALARGLEGLRAAAATTRTLTIEPGATFDIGPAWLLHRALEDLAVAGVAVRIEGERPGHFEYFDELESAAPAAHPEEAAAPGPLVLLGRHVIERGASWLDAVSFGGRALATAARAWRSVRRVRLPSVVRHAYETGVQAIPVVAVIALLISVISAYIGAFFNDTATTEIYTVDLV